MFKEGFLAVYKGLSSPLYTMPLINAVSFGTYSITKEFLRVNYHIFYLTDQQINFYSSLTAGFLNAFVAGPIELFKTKLQVQQNKKYYKSNLDIFRKLYRVSGVKGIF